MTPEQRTREHALAEAFVGLADTLVDTYDVIELLHRLSNECVALLPVDAAGLVLSDHRGRLSVAAYSTEQADLAEQFQLQTDEGPCLDSFRTSSHVSSSDLRDEPRWPRFATFAVQSGYLAVHALPLHLRTETIGSLSLFVGTPNAMSADDVRIGQALADVATIGVLQERAIRRHELLAEQLEAALNSRVIIEQAKGVLAERAGIDVAEAFERMRRHARSTNRRLTDLARSVVDGSADLAVLLAPPRRG